MNAKDLDVTEVKATNDIKISVATAKDGKEYARIWAPFNEFAKGAVRALEQAGRTDIKVYGVDMSDEDLQIIQKDNSPWVASAAVDPTDIGRVQVRYAYQILDGETVEPIISLNLPQA